MTGFLSPPRTSYLEVGGTYQYDAWVYLVVRQHGPSGMAHSFEVLSLTDYSYSIKSGHLVEVATQSAVAQYSLRIA